MDFNKKIAKGLYKLSDILWDVYCNTRWWWVCSFHWSIVDIADKLSKKVKEDSP